MQKKDYYIRVYKINPPIGKIYGWGAKGTSVKNGTEVTTSEVFAKSEEKVREKINAMIEKGGENLWLIQRQQVTE